MRIWYKNSAHQMDDPEMEYLQSIDAGACAVWEWAKGSCKQRDDCVVPNVKDIELRMTCRRLGVTKERLDKIIKGLVEVNWVDASGDYLMRLSKWDQWQCSYRSSQDDAKRKRDGYWKTKVENSEGLKLNVPASLEDADFLKAWKEWIGYRRSHQAQIADESIFFQKQLNWLAVFGPRKAIEILEVTMRNSWQGLDAAARMLEK